MAHRWRIEVLEGGGKRRASLFDRLDRWNETMEWNGMVVGSVHAFNSLVVSSRIPAYQWRYLYVFILPNRPPSWPTLVRGWLQTLFF